MVNFKLKVQLLCALMMFLLIETGVIMQFTREQIPTMTKTIKVERGIKHNKKCGCTFTFSILYDYDRELWFLKKKN